MAFIALVKAVLNFAVVTKPQISGLFYSKGVLFCSAGLFNPETEGDYDQPWAQVDRGAFTGLCGSKVERLDRLPSMGFFCFSENRQLLLLPIFLWSELVTWPFSVARRMIQLPMGLKEKRDQILVNNNINHICPSTHAMIAPLLFLHRKYFSRPQ